MHYCTTCRTPITRGKDILSANYHGGKGPAYLASRVYNVAIGLRVYGARFTTGTYLVTERARA